MKEKVYSKKEFGKSVIVAVAAIGTSALLFTGLAQAAMAAELGGTDTVSTSYSTAASPQKKTLPEGYKKANYAVAPDELCKDQPGEKDLTRGEAAELGAQMMWELFGVDLEGATFYMGYNSGTETFPRAFWSGDIRFGDTRTPEDPGYYFTIDAVTGERFIGSLGRTLDVKVDLGLDMALAKNPEKYVALAEEMAEKTGLVHGDVQKVEYNCQGYSGNDPDITLNVIGVNGEKAMMTFSRYDQKLKGVSYDAERRISEPAQQKLEEELEKKIDALRKADNGKNDNNPGLLAAN